MKPSIHLVAAGAAALLLQGCMAPAPVPVPVAERREGSVAPATLDQVKACVYIDDVASASGRYGILADQALEVTKAEVLKKAAALGATHLVWEAPQIVPGSTSSHGKAYRCP